jgi:hypothetical protein
MSETDETIQNIVADTAETVADRIDDFAEATRALTRAKIQFTTLGYALGALTGAFVAWKVAYKRAETKFSAFADEEIAEMRLHYQAKITAAEAQAQKLSPVKDIVVDRGYAPEPEDVQPPMAVSPPTNIVEAVAETTSEETTRTPPPVPVQPAPPAEVRNVFRNAKDEANIVDTWNYEEELRKRDPDSPYVIHYDERYEIEGYSEMTLTLYERDDVLCNERDEVIADEEREQMVGEDNLLRFGHGSNDPQIVYIRNDKLELVLEVVKSPNSFAEEVHGFTHMGYSGNLEKMRKRERESLDDEG